MAELPQLNPPQTYTPIGPEPEFAPLPPLDETEPLFSEYFEAAAGNTLRDSPVKQLAILTPLSASNSGPFCARYLTS